MNVLQHNVFRLEPTMDNPFPLPDKLSPDLQRVFSYWESLERGETNMPFWDDVKLSALPDLADRLLLLDVQADPERFRVNTLGAAAGDQAGALRGKFIDEVTLGGPLQFLRAQASATVEARAATFYRSASFSRMLLPMWGDGRIGMLLGALDPH
jgi:hypothetical protein